MLTLALDNVGPVSQDPPIPLLEPFFRSLLEPTGLGE